MNGGDSAALKARGSSWLQRAARRYCQPYLGVGHGGGHTPLMGDKRAVHRWEWGCLRLLAYVSLLSVILGCLTLLPPVNRVLSGRPYCYKPGELKPVEEGVTAAISTNVRDEPNIAEWVAYHLLLGFDRILVVDHHSEYAVADRLAGYEFMQSGKVEVVVPEQALELIEFRPKLSIMKTVVLPFMRKHTPTWFIHVDADEYVNLRGNFPSIQAFLACYPMASAIPVRWHLFGTSGHDAPPSGLIIEEFTRALPLSEPDWTVPGLDFIAKGGFLTKVFVRTADVKWASDPHYWPLTNGKRGRTPTTMHKWKPNHWIKYGHQCYDEELVLINHYATLDFMSFLQRKVLRPRDDTNEPREGLPSMSLAEIQRIVHSIYHEFEDTYVAETFGPKVRDMLQKEKCSALESGQS